jgi:hypothetical protein
MLQAARSAPSLLREAVDRVTGFLRGQFNPDGGAVNRSGRSDLYYTVFALQGLLALGAEPPVGQIGAFLRSFGDGDGLDMVHRACLARCWACVPEGLSEDGVAERLLQHIEGCRSADGGYAARPAAVTGTAYHCFLAMGAYEDLGRPMPAPEGLVRCLDGLRTDDGAYANEHQLRSGSTPATAAAAVLMRCMGVPVPPEVGEWLAARCCADGGFAAAPGVPVADLLSTATALHALAGMGISLERVKEPCLDYLDSLWTGRAFRGHRADAFEDSEYTFYGLLALGHLCS